MSQTVPGLKCCTYLGLHLLHPQLMLDPCSKSTEGADHWLQSFCMLEAQCRQGAAHQYWRASLSGCRPRALSPPKYEAYKRSGGRLYTCAWLEGQHRNVLKGAPAWQQETWQGA